jgi:hypothetical protein
MIDMSKIHIFWTGTGFFITILAGLASWAVSLAIRFFVRIISRGS